MDDTPLQVTTVTWSTEWWEPGLRLAVAMVCAATIGWDREAEGRAAGLRTHIMVALGACGFTLVAMELLEVMDKTAGSTSLDPAKILGGIVGGVGFLGAGAIIQAGGKVRGLTTAAGLWVMATIGMAAGSGYISVAIMLTAFAFMTMVLLRRFEKRRFARSDDQH